MSQYLWPYETGRWHELVFCILSAQGQSVFRPPVHREVAREAVSVLTQLQLLEIEALAATLGDDGTIDEEDPLFPLRANVLERLGYPSEVVAGSLVTIAEAASGLHQSYDGKIQKLLRQAGAAMLEDVAENFKFSVMPKAGADYVFTHWMQNVLSMPMGLHNPSIHLFCKSAGITPDELVEIADDADLNLALLDDLAIDIVEGLVASDSQTVEAA